MRMKLIWSLLVSFACLCSATNLAARSEGADNGNYTSKDREFYLTPEQLLFIRPGLVLKITDVVIPADRKTEVTFTLSDPAGMPLDRTGIDTPGPVSTSFVLAYIPEYEEAYVAYTTRVQTSPITGDSVDQASTDSGGTYTTLSIGTYKYKFGTEVPADYQTDATTTVGVYAVRNLDEFDLGTYVANTLDSFIPSGIGEPMPRDIVTTETCNGRCHAPLSAHGGSRQAVGLCVLCHNPSQGIDPDTGSSVDFPLMVHKIHMGEALTQDYTVIGYRQAVHNYNDVVYPAPINQCDTCHTGGIPTENFPMVATPATALVCDSSGMGETVLTWQAKDNVEIKVRSASNPDGTLFAIGGPTGSAATGKWVADGTWFDIFDLNTKKLISSVPVSTTVLGCVSNAPGTWRGEPGTQHTNWMDHPSRVNCGSCHDNIDWETGEGHSEYNLVMVDDITCGNCHVPYTTKEFDRSVKGAHLVLYKSSQFPGVLVKFLEVTNTNPGDHPTVKFSVGSKNAPLDPASLNRFRLTLSGPNADYSFWAQENAINAAVWAGDNTWTYTFANPLPLDAEGSFTISFEGRNIVPIDFDPVVEDERDNAENPRIAFAVTDAVATPRRTVVEDYNCESCHSNLAFHGGGRHDPQYCDTCHMPKSLDIDEEQTIHFKYMIHSIHMGEHLQYGFAIGTHNYSDVVYPGDLRVCDACHVNNSQQVPVASDLLATMTPQAFWYPMMPNAAACLSCHDDDSSAAHAYANTTFFGESCGVCHGEGRSEAVDKVHALP